MLSIVDGAVLLVDATEGPMSQTKFVLGKALGLGLRPIVVINKVDRESARAEEVEGEVFELFDSLGATEEQLDFVTLFASAKDGWAGLGIEERDKGMVPLLDTVVEKVPPPDVRMEMPFRFLVTMLSRDAYLGRIAIGRVVSGNVKINDTVHVLSRDGEVRPSAKVTRITSKRGLVETELEVASAGDIVSIAGVSDMTVGDTFHTADTKKGEEIKPLHAPAIDPPTVSVIMNNNDSPLQGKDGKVLTTQALSNWLHAEAENNVSINVTSGVGQGIEVKGRGELQLGILIETLRREGCELAISPPKVLTKEGEDGQVLEPVEELMVEVDEDHSGAVIEKLSARGANLLDTKPCVGGRMRIRFLCPSRSLLGYRPQFVLDTKGTGLLNSAFAEWAPMSKAGNPNAGRKGAIVSMADGLTSAYALASLEAKGTLFVRPREDVYAGMVVGEHVRDGDIDVNPVRAKALTNMRTQQKDEGIRLSPPRIFGLEGAISYIGNDELIEVTPKNIRIRKRILDLSLRQAEARKLRKKKK